MLSRETIERAIECIEAHWTTEVPKYARGRDEALSELRAELQILTSASTDCNQYKAKPYSHYVILDDSGVVQSGTIGAGCTLVPDEEKVEELEEAARQYAESRGNGVVLEKLLSTAFLAGAEWANTRPAPEVPMDHSGDAKAYACFDPNKHVLREVLAESWVIVGPHGTVISLTNASCEARAWGAIPLDSDTPEQRSHIIAEHKAEGYRAVKVKIVEVG
jgi:hypothetical protein